MIIGHAHPQDSIEFSVDGWGIVVGASFCLMTLATRLRP